MLRLFVALRPQSSIRDLLLDTTTGVPGARWQDDAQLHVTLRFIGEVDARTAEDIDAALGAIVAPPVTLRIDGVGQFDARGRATAIWAGVSPRDAVAALHRKVDAALVRAGLAPERRAYLPHVTIARLNAGSGPVDEWLRDHAALTSPAWSSDRFGLYESRLSRTGAQYERVASYPLTTR